MCTSAELSELTRQVVSSYEDVYGKDIVGIYLYGSYARGDYGDQSDVDFVAIVEGERITLQKKLQQVWDQSSEIGMDYDIIISPTVIPLDEFEKYRATYPYYQNISKEGLKVG